jgi:hypothetical protein
MKPSIGKAIERIRARVDLGSFFVIAIIAKISAAGPKAIGRNRTETPAKMIDKIDSLLFSMFR